MSPREAERAEAELRHRTKQTLRAQMRAVRTAIPASACDARSAAISKRLFALAELDAASTVLAFASIRNEVRTRPSIEEAWSAGKRVALPRVVGNELRLHLVTAETLLSEGAFAVPEPPESSSLPVPPDSSDEWAVAITW